MLYVGGYISAQSKVLNHLRLIEGATASTKDLIEIVWSDPDEEPENPQKVLHHVVMFLRRRGFPIWKNGRNGYSFVPEGCVPPVVHPKLIRGPNIIRLSTGAVCKAWGALARSVLKALRAGPADKHKLVSRVYQNHGAGRLAPWSSVAMAICRLRRKGYDIACSRDFTYSLKPASDGHGHGQQVGSGAASQARGRSREDRAPAGRGRDLAA